MKECKLMKGINSRQTQIAPDVKRENEGGKSRLKEACIRKNNLRRAWYQMKECKLTKAMSSLKTPTRQSVTVESQIRMSLLKET
jgi:hypothetical protein